MKEQKRLYILMAIVALLIVLVLGINFVSELQSKKTLDEINYIFENNDKKTIVIGRKGCPYCEMFAPLLDYMKGNYDFDYLYIDTNNISKQTLNKIIDKLNIDPDKFGTPHLSFIENGQVADEIGGYADEKELLQFLQRHGYASESDKLPLNYIDFDQYKNLINSDSGEIIVIGQTNCSACMMARPDLLSIAKEYGIKINYFDMTTISEDDDLIEEFNSSLEFLTQEEWGTPLMLFVKNKKVEAASKGYLSKDNYLKFLQEQGLIGN